MNFTNVRSTIVVSVCVLLSHAPITHIAITFTLPENPLMNEPSTTLGISTLRRRKWLLLFVGVVLLVVCGFVYISFSSYPLYRANRTPGRPWSAWDAADHDVDGKLTREEMERFGKQMSHRNVDELLGNFDAADSDHDGIVTQSEIDIYGTNIGSMEPKKR